MTRLRHALALAALLCIGPLRAHAEESVLELEGPADIDITQLLREDIDGDGVEDLLLVAGREVLVWSGGKGALPKPTPRWRFAVPKNVSFVDPVPRSTEDTPTLALFGRDGLTYQLPGKAPTTPAWDVPGPTWSDAERVTFADLLRPGDVKLIPTAHGIELHAPNSNPVKLALEVDAHVSEAGPFLEDTTDVVIAYPEVVIGAGPSGSIALDGTALWALSGNTLVAQMRSRRAAYDLSFLPRDGDRRILDLDADGLPDVVHRTSTNFEGSYVFFRTPSIKAGDKNPRPGQANTVLRLSGNQIAHDFEDLNGDGRLDFVATTIDVDGKNTVGALTSGKVTAKTRAFLNRAGDPKAKRWFASEPDATVTSEVGVRILFTYAGQIDVQRQLTIVVDGDYDGDGLLDLAIRTDPKTITIWPGRKAGGWAEEGRKIAIPPLGAYADIEGYAYDANGDGKDEIFLVYRAEHRDGSGTETRERLFLVSPAG